MLLDVQRGGSADRQEWRHATQNHIAFVSNILSQLREIKMLGLGTALSKVMRQYQEHEIHTSTRVRIATELDDPGGTETPFC